jgi:hypothetical protein
MGVPLYIFFGEGMGGGVAYYLMRIRTGKHQRSKVLGRDSNPGPDHLATTPHPLIL